MAYAKLFEKRISVWALSLILLMASGCATVNVPNVGEKGYSLEAEERRLFKRSEEVCDVIDATDEVYSNRELEEYLNRLVQKLTLDTNPTDRTISVKVLNAPDFNAFALPNGRIFVNIGALSAADNEAQLATLLGHELTHVLNRHALKQFRSLQNKSAFMSVFDIPLAVVGGSAGILLGRLGMLSSIYGYSQQHEFEADEKGFEAIEKLNYDARESPKLFENLLVFIKSEEVSQPFFFSTHPHVKERIKNFNVMLEQRNYISHDGLIIDTPEFQKFAYEIYTTQIRLCLSRGMFKTAEQNFVNLEKRYANLPETFYLGGEIYRLRQDAERKGKKRDKRDDYPKASERYRQALKIDANYAPAIVSQARVLEKLGQKDEAKVLFKKYLEVNPQAADREYIENFIKG
ncbi:MAG: M48 family metalloprotease [Candidatus Omnitrophica bacterium]|nr:M48 family metalloprotease [Candidatus Omnitrophota bacterium]